MGKSRNSIMESVIKKSCFCCILFSISIKMKVIIYLMVLTVAAKVETFTTTARATTLNEWSTQTTTTTNQSSLTASILNRRAWPMQHYDIWNDVERAKEVDAALGSDTPLDERDGIVLRPFKRSDSEKTSSARGAKVIHLFPVPVDGECISSDGRRTGTCFNAYECRAKGGAASGECAHGFGVCCIFSAACNETISNNITYLISPNFPSFMANNVTACSLKVKLLSDDISQLRVDFQHFSLGQPNRRSGVCDGDAFRISGGPGGVFSLCGQNSGQHIYYDVGGRFVARQTLYGSLRPLTYAQIYGNTSHNSTESPSIEISMIFSERFLPIRLWEIRIAQIPFSQRAPAGCLQYYTGREGVIQTFNYAENGRHLANQNYRICMRQETEMCSIMYQPCDQQSFRIAPNTPIRNEFDTPGMVGGTSGGLNGGSTGNGVPSPVNSSSNLTNLLGTVQSMNPVNQSACSNRPGLANVSTMPPAMSVIPSAGNDPLTDMLPEASSPSAITQANAVTVSSPSSSSMEPETVSMVSSPDDSPDAESPPTEAASSSLATPFSTPTPSTTVSSLSSTPLTDDVEGSGDDSGPETSSRRPRPVSGGFDFIGFLRSAFDFGLGRSLGATRPFRKSRQYGSPTQLRQFYSGCMDRITMPCIVEDFIGPAAGNLGIPDCEPIHCGDSFCSSGEWPCRVESTVTPFYLTVHFGRGANKGSPEDNIGACLRYTQVQCL